MIFKNLAWDTFINTGNVETYLAMKELEMQENKIQNMNNNETNGRNNGNNKN